MARDGDDRDPSHAAAVRARLSLFLVEWQVVPGAAVEAADERAFGDWPLLLHIGTDASPGQNLRD